MRNKVNVSEEKNLERLILSQVRDGIKAAKLGNTMVRMSAGLFVQQNLKALAILWSEKRAAK